MSNTLKPGALKFLKIIGIVAVILCGYFLKTSVWDKRERDVSEEIKIVGQVSIPDAPEASLSGNAVKLAFPTSKQSNNAGTKLIHEVMTWQSQNSWSYANGGIFTTKGSLFEQYSLNVEIRKQNDCVQSCSDFINFCKQYKDNPSTTGMCVTYMGTGIPSYASTILEATKELGPEYAPIVIFSSGRSNGEDQLIGDVAIRNNPQLLRGQIVIGVRLDGDMDIPMKYANDNKVPFNPNPKFYDPTALNASYPSSGDFVESATKYNAGTLEKRIIVINGKTTGRDTLLAPTLVATWFPADKTAIDGKGGGTIVSTKDYAAMMPNITIFCKKWVNDHRTDCENLVIALAQAGDQIRSFDDAKRYACKLNATIYGEQDETFWYNGYNGIQKGNGTQIGGSMVFNLADMANLFGMNGKNDIYKAVYTTFGELQAKYYPTETQLHPFMDYNKLVDKSILMSVIANHPELMEGKVLEKDYTQEMTDVVSSASEQILFRTGSAEIDPNSFELLNTLHRQLLTSDGLKIRLVGHTDNTGQAGNNQILSLQRARSVKSFFVEKGILEIRIEAEGRGQAEPVASNNTSAGKALNRRVEIITLR